MRFLVGLILHIWATEDAFFYSQSTPGERICFHPQTNDANVQYSLYKKDTELGPIGLTDCHEVQNRFMGDSLEPAPLSWINLPKAVDCSGPTESLEVGTHYKLGWSDNNGDIKFSTDTFEYIDSEFTAYTDGQSDYSCWRRHSIRKQERNKELTVGNAANRNRRQVNPTITGIIPRNASPNGGAIITILGHNLKSKILDIGGQKSESEDQGETFEIWFGRDWGEGDGETTFPCKIDRMLGLHLSNMAGVDTISCVVGKVLRPSHYWLRLKIDDGDTMYGTHVYFAESAAPTVGLMYPGPSSPAKPSDAYDYEGVFYTKWFDVDTDDTDEVEDESMYFHVNDDAEVMSECVNPLAIEVMNKRTGLAFVPSKNENADGHAIPTYMDTLQGFKCEDSAQTVDGIMCPDVKIRYKCLPGLNEFKGRIYTDVHGRSDHPDFHVNRIMETPKIVNEDDGFKGSAQIFLNDGENCGAHPNCGVNERLPMKVTSGDNGIIRYVADVAIPGAYNFTFQVFHNGFSMANTRNWNFMTDDNLIPVNYEIYPSIHSIHPHMGSVEGSTLITISGTGFIEDGLGGMVTVDVGGDMCDVESMTEREIICKTRAKAEDPVGFPDNRVFTPFTGFGHDSNAIINKWEGDTYGFEVKTEAHCMELCRTDASCVMYVFKAPNNCYHYSFHTSSVDATYHTDHYTMDAWDSAVGGYLAWESETDETNCFTGRGEKYIGSVAVTKWGKDCKSGTFCRNPNPLEQSMPYCETTDGSVEACDVIYCSGLFGTYSGNRGSRVKVQKSARYYREVDELVYPEARYNGPGWTWLAHSMAFSIGKFYGTFQGNKASDYRLRARNYFVAPYDGIFSFYIRGDDAHQLAMVHEDGRIESLGTAVYAYHVDKEGEVPGDWSKHFNLVKGDKIALQTSFTEASGDDHATVGVNYHGKTEDSGTWLDTVSRKHFQQDVYVYDRQELKVRQTGKRDNFWLFLNYPKDIQSNVGIPDGEEWSSDRKADFKIKWCGDGDNCFETNDIDMDLSGYGDRLEDDFDSWLETECSTSGTFNPLHYYGGYEKDAHSDWPGSYHFTRNHNSYCGRYTHETHNHDFWNTKLGGAFSTNDIDDVCFAYQGNVEGFYVYGTFKYDDDEGKEKSKTEWLFISVNWSSLNSYTHKCIKISDTIAPGGAYNGLTIKNGIKVSNLRLWNDEVSPIYIDELRVGQMRGGSFSVTQTKKAISFGGQVPYRIKVSKSSNYWWGQYFHLELYTWSEAAVCGESAPLPYILPSGKAGIVNKGDTNMVYGSDWTTASPPLVINNWDDFLTTYIYDVNNKDYRRMHLEYTDTSVSPVQRSIYNAVVFRRDEMPSQLEDIPVQIEMEGSSEVLNVNFGYSLWPSELRTSLVETWPELGDDGLNIEVWRNGWCNEGYKYGVRTREHGNMRTLTLTATLPSGFFIDPVSGAEWHHHSSVPTRIVPGSVITTHHNVPQVVVTANGQRSACKDCDFQFLNRYTPELVSVNPSSGQIAMGDAITFGMNVKDYMGEFPGFNAVVGDSLVENCLISSDMDSSGDRMVDMACEVGASGEGTNQPVQVRIPDLGVLDMATTLSITTAITSATPTAGSTHGGTIVTVEGTGFFAGQVVTVDFNGESVACDSTGLDVSYTLLMCRTASNSGSGTVSPQLDSVSPNKLTVMGGEKITLTGSDFTSSCDGSVVYIGDAKAKTVSWTDTEVIAIAPAQAHKSSRAVRVYVCNHGESNSIDVNTRFQVTGVSSTFSSLAGGNMITVTGFGFASQAETSSDATLWASVGDLPCEISELSYSKFVCKTAPYKNRVELQVTGRGIYHKGVKVERLEIEQGTEVLWSWRIAISGVVPFVRFQKTSNAGDMETSTGDYWSGEFQGDAGQFMKFFKNKATYHYSTGLIDSATIFSTSTLVVIQATDKPMKMSVQMNGFHAKMADFDSNQPTDPCEMIGTSTAMPPTDVGPWITYSWGVTPAILIDYHGDTVAGEGKVNFIYNIFDLSACNTRITASYGDYLGTFDSVISTRYIFNLDPAGSMDPESTYTLRVNMDNIGDAYYFDYSSSVDSTTNVVDEYSLGGYADTEFGGQVDSVNIDSFSLNGDVDLVFTGHGFTSETIGNLDITLREDFTVKCRATSQTYNEVQCRLDKIGKNDMGHTFNVFVNEYDTGFQVYSKNSETPAVTSMDRNSITADNNVITFTGSNLDGLMVMAGAVQATVSASGGSATATFEGIQGGRHPLKFHAITGGVTVGDNLDTITVAYSASAISPVSGGLNGGTLVTVTGFGFDKDIVVEMYDSTGERLCEFCRIVEVVDTNTLVFYSARVESVGMGKVVVKHEYLMSDNTFELSFEYVDTSASVDSVSGTTSDLVGGETITFAVTNEGSCANMAVEVVQAQDPCAFGAHECADSATCSPTSDGLDYTCDCPACSWCDDWQSMFSYHGSGKDCFQFVQRGKTNIDGAEAMCEASSGESIFRVESKYDEDNLESLLRRGLTSNRGLFVKWYGTVTCLKLTETDGVFAFEFPEGACDSWGNEGDAFEKKVICRKYPRRNCFDDTMDNGRYTYKGSYDKGLTGIKCSSWEETTWFDDYEHHPHYLTKGDVCRNLWNTDHGPFCAADDEWNWDGGRKVLQRCPIPTCEQLENGAKRFACAIRPALRADPDEYVYKYDETDPFVRDNNCYLGSENANRLHNPHRCYYDSRYPMVFRVNTISVGVHTVERVQYDDNGLYLSADPTNPDVEQQVKYVEDGTDAKAQLSVIDDLFAPGTSSIRAGEYFIASGSGGAWMTLVHQSEVAELEDVMVLAWVFECPTEDLGDLIEQPRTSFMVKATITPTCSAGSVSFNVPSLPAGSYKAILRSSEYGQAVNAIDLDYVLAVDSFSPAKIGTNGGIFLTLMGSGFNDMTEAYLCGLNMKMESYTTATGSDSETLVYLVPDLNDADCSSGLVLKAVDGSDGSDISTNDSRRRRAISGLTVDPAENPTITMVEPKIGGTMGGTLLTITGTSFGSVSTGVTVTFFDEVACDIQSVSPTQITCLTNAFPRGNAQVAIAPVVFIPGGPGIATDMAVEPKDTQFWYMDRWSSPYTWGCTDDSCKPQTGEIIVIPAGQVILLDETTPLLAVLIIDGGTMIWDRSDGIELHMQYGVVNNGGHFEIGNADEPFCSGNALIKMYGHQRSINLPIYGAKVFAIRFGTFEIHGCPKTTTWTELAETVETGATQITLTHPVKDDWFVGNEIVVAATGDLTNFHRSEKRVIDAVSEDGYTVTLTEPLDHRHIAVCTNGPNDNGLGWGWAGEICTRAEVGLLTRNVKMMGNINNDWTEDLPECKLGPGTAFGTQTCFQNRYGHETGSDQFGSVLFLHKPTYARIAFFEVTHAGQAFNLARYPIHFHTPGSMPDSYVRGCGIHNTFNRALTLHGIHDIIVEHNVVFNIMGLAFFLEDAVEENNILRYNLGIMNKKSSSLLNVDSTPSVFWITNPNNIFYGNRVAGSSHFGYWFNPPEDGPTGPSSKDPQYDHICPKNRPLGQFYNNTAHSLGKYGLWIFTDLTPTADGECGMGVPKANKFGWMPEIDVEGNAVPEDTFGFFAWHCERGAEIATGGALQFWNMIAANNWIAGLAGKETFLHTYADGEHIDQSQLFKRNIVIGHLSGDPELDACGDMGIETPWKFFSFTVDDIHFFNFDEPTPDKSSVGDPSNFGMASELAPRRCVAFDPCYGTNAFDCGAVTWFRDVKWYNSQRRTGFTWEAEAAVLDKDGSFTGGSPGDYVIAASDAFNPDLCTIDDSGKYDNSNTDPRKASHAHPAMRCKGENANGDVFKPHRFMFNHGLPDSVEGTMAVFTNQYGTTKSGFRNCRPRGSGWMVMLQGNEEYSMHFEQHDHISNISYVGDIDDFETGEWLTIRHDFPEKIDYANMVGAKGSVVEKVNVWGDPLVMDTYSYNVNNDTYEVRYVFNGNANEANPQMSPGGDAYTWGESFLVSPQFHKCFFKDCITPPPAPPTLPPPLVSCNFIDCLGGLPADFSDIHIGAGQQAIIDAAAVAAAGGHFKFASVFVDGTLEIPGSSLTSGSTLIIEGDHFVVNTGQGDNRDLISSRRRRDTVQVTNGNIIIGTADSPIPCDVKIVLKINGDENSQSFGAMPGSIPIGAKALGGIGGIQMHGCVLTTTWTTLTNTINAGDSSITVDGDVSEWKVGNELAIATTDFEQRHTEYVSITAISGQTITLNTTILWTHLGSADTTINVIGKTLNQGAEVALLTRNIVVDGSPGAEGKMGGRILISNYMETNGVHTYNRDGYGQFSFVEFKGMGQYGYSNYDDLRAGILFYDVNTAGDVATGLLPSYVKGCAFHAGFHTAVAAMFNSDGLEISNNVIFGTVESAIRTDSMGLNIDGNVIGNVFHRSLYQEMFESTTNTNFPDDMAPAGIRTSETSDATVTNNRVAGVDGSCYEGNGDTCDDAEACATTNIAGSNQGNIGHSCLRGYFIIYGGHAACTKVSGFQFSKILYYGVTSQSTTNHLVINDVVIEDSNVGVYAIMVGPDSTMHLSAAKDVTIKNSYISGRGDHYDCTYDNNVKDNVYADKFAARQSSLKVTHGDHVAIIASNFNIKSNGYPICPWTANAVEPAIYGNTCVVNTKFANYNRKCSVRDSLTRPNKETSDHVFPITFMTGNSKVNVNADDISMNLRPKIKTVNIADCVDLFCDGYKHNMVIDNEGTIFGTAGTLMAEAEFEWDGITRTQPDGTSLTYEQTSDGLGDYRIPAPMKTRLDGSQIPIDEVRTDMGIVRNNACTWNENYPGWFCPEGTGADRLRYFDLVYESMDADHMRRRLSPVAVRSDGHITLANGPGDHSCCIGYACFIRLSTFHLPVACGKQFDIYLSSTTPLDSRWHLSGPEDCKIKVTFYTKRPNRIDIAIDGDYVAPTNAEVNSDGSISWQKPDLSTHMVEVDSHHPGDSFHDRDSQEFHFIMSGGHVYDMTTVQTLVLELGMMTEMTDDEFYDNGNLANNIAALLGIDPSKIRIMNVIREDARRRRRRREDAGFMGFSLASYRFRRQTEATAASLQIEISPDDTESGVAALSDLAEDVINNAGDIANAVADATGSEVEAEIAVARPPPAPETPPEAVPLTALLGMRELTPEDDVSEFLKEVEEALGGSLDDLQTAEEAAEQAQSFTDAANEAIIYDTPTRMEIQSQPTKPQSLDQPFFTDFVLIMYDQNDVVMTTVGYVDNPWKVRIEIVDPVVTGTNPPSPDGTTKVAFFPGSGLATFDNVIVTGDVTSCKFKFTIADPSDQSSVIPPVISNVVTLIEAAPEGECVVDEGPGFDKKESWSAGCDFVCLSPCNDIGGGGAPECNDVTHCEDSDTMPTYATCGLDGCNCNMTIVPSQTEINPADFIYAECTPSSLEVKINKCVMNRFGFHLADLYIAGPDETDDFSSLGTSDDNNCRGMMGYDHGPQYIFSIDRSFGDCGTNIEANGTHNTYSNAIQGSAGIDNGVIKRTRNLFTSFSCVFLVDISVSIGIGAVEAQSIEIDLDDETGAFDITMAAFTDATFSIVADDSHSVVVPEDLYIGIALADAATEFVTFASDCWITATSDPADTNMFNLIIDGCVNSEDADNIAIIENGQSHQSRISFASFQFVGLEANNLHAHCSVQMCTTQNMDDCTPSCSRRRRSTRGRREDSSNTISTSLGIVGEICDCQNADEAEGICRKPCIVEPMIIRQI